MGASKLRRWHDGLLGWGILALAAGVLVGAPQLEGCRVPGRSAGNRPADKVPALDAGTVDLSAVVRTPDVAAAPAAPATQPKAKPVATDHAGRLAGPQAAAPQPAAPGPLEVICPDAAAAQARFFFTPAAPQPGRPLRVTVVADQDLPSPGIEIVRAEGRVPLAGVTAWGGPPYAWSAALDEAPAGAYRFLLVSGDPARPFACGDVTVAATPKDAAAPTIATGAWTVTRAWDRATENLYAAWVGRLFLVDAGAKAGWRPLHQVMRDAKRNLLFDYLGLREDDADSKVKVILTPDCADTPFFLRAYFSWKLGLPFAARRCLRGDAIHGPTCDADPVTNLTPDWDGVNSIVERFNRFVGITVAETVHSGTVRTIPEDPSSDLYPVALTQEAIRPGTVFVDPMGHVLVITRWLPGTAERMGMLLAIDAHPDLTVSHKRFSPANFFFAEHLRTGGFKEFRPAIYEHGKVRLMTNAELTAHGYAAPSLDQYELADTAAFYRTVDKLLNPIPLDPVQAYRSRMEALVELLDERVSAVQVAIDYQQANGWAKIDMPVGGAIFETSGPWEDYSSPARDLRLLLAVDELLAFPRYVQDNPDLFRIPAGKTMAQVRSDLDAAWTLGKDELSITYHRSDRSEWKLDLGQIVDRVEQFEQAYNPNDCPEARWGAAPGTAEFSTCTHRAPLDQRKMMAAYRMWHAERRRPSGF